MTALDASAAAKLVVAERGSGEMQALVSSDALYLVTAQRLQQTVLLAYDQQQARAADALGLQPSSPGWDDGWWR